MPRSGGEKVYVRVQLTFHPVKHHSRHSLDALLLAECMLTHWIVYVVGENLPKTKVFGNRHIRRYEDSNIRNI